MDSEEFYGDRGNTSWETKMYSKPKINLETYQEYNSTPIHNTQNRGSTGWEALMAKKLSYLPGGRRMGDERSINAIYSNSMKGNKNLSSVNK